ncbi:transmembrane protein, putative [Bodo saltans]|uniref:Transmembrane protein, putative n=1 Tax=Bodo saltans TaxID=75058 RepID=A0A0S4KMA3_BODSA|nr:transmembrane protein, putative [Bodo saltans]|eukprot:CUI12962.1 transmembrane protein, putative [Bodo saltans]
MFQRHPCCMWWTLVLIVLTTSTTFFVVAQIVPPSPNISYQYIDCPSSSTTASDMMIQASVLTVAHDNTTTTSLLLSRDYFWWVYNCSVPRRIFVTSSNITSTTTQPSSYSFSFFRVIIATAIVSLSVSEHVDRCDVFFYASDATAPPSDAPANFFGSSSSFTYLVARSRWYLVDRQ